MGVWRPPHRAQLTSPFQQTAHFAGKIGGTWKIVWFVKSCLLHPHDLNSVVIWMHFKAERQVRRHEEGSSYPVSYSWLWRGRLAKGDASHDYYRRIKQNIKISACKWQLTLYHMQDAHCMLIPHHVGLSRICLWFNPIISTVSYLIHESFKILNKTAKKPVVHNLLDAFCLIWWFIFFSK